MHGSKWWKNKRIRKNIAKCVNKNSFYGIMEKKKGVKTKANNFNFHNNNNSYYRNNNRS